MSRLIDADALEKKLHEFALDEWNQRAATSWSNAFFECEDIVYNAQTVEAEPVRHGHWKEDEARIKDQCSACGLSVNWSRFKTPYCPFCGAKMDEVTDDNA